MNKVILTGRLTRDPERRVTNSGTSVCTFTLAVNRRFAKRAEEAGQPTADFIPIVTWSKLADVCGNNLVKGRQVSVEGRMQVRNYDAQDGTKRYVTEVVAENVEFLDSKNSSAGGGEFQPRPESSTAPSMGAPEGSSFGAALPDEEIPF